MYSIQSTGGFFADLEEAKNKNADDEDADLFSVLDQLESYRTCSGQFHFKLCYPELAENFTFPCNEWTQSNNPVYDSIFRDFQPVKITFMEDNFKGLGMSERGKGNSLIDYWPFESNWWLSVGTIKGGDNDVIAGPDPHWVTRVELYVNLDMEKPVIINPKNKMENMIFEECSGESWNAAEGAIGKDAELIVDMECPFKLQKIRIVNGIGEFSTKRFTVFGAEDSRGPWARLFSGDLEQRATEVR